MQYISVIKPIMCVVCDILSNWPHLHELKSLNNKINKYDERIMY